MKLVLIICVAATLVPAVCSTAAAQGPPVHYFHAGDLPPGTIGQGQLLRFPHMRGYFQPVQISLPEGVRVSVNIEGRFDTPREGPVLAGMLVGQVYPLQITSIPFYEGSEIYPTVEIINRIYPPPGQELHFPIPLHVTREELELALTGRFVTRVIYLEDPDTALAYRDEPEQQRYFEAAPDQDPLRIADRLGRPLAILRMGSRIPDLDASGAVAYHPPIQLYQPPGPQQAAAITAAINREVRDYPRIPDQSVPTQSVPTQSPPSRVYRVGAPIQP